MKSIDPASIPTSQDFLPLQKLCDLEQALRCEICADLFASPVLLTSCSHAFCSLCIRTHLAAAPSRNDARCPICNTSASDNHIKPIRILEQIVSLWRDVRPTLLQLKDIQARLNGGEVLSAPSTSLSKKRKGDRNAGDSFSAKRARFALESNAKGKGKARADDSESSDIEITRTTDPEFRVACFNCGKEMPNAAMDKHIDRCLSIGPSTKEKKGKASGKPNAFDALVGPGRENKQAQSLPSKMNQINSNLFKLDEVRAKLKTLNLYDSDSAKDKAKSQEALVSLYNRYVLLYNSNMDRSVESREEPGKLRKQARQLEDSHLEAQKKMSQFDPKAHLRTYKADFDELIASVKERQKALQNAIVSNGIIPASEHPVKPVPVASTIEEAAVPSTTACDPIATEAIAPTDLSSDQEEAELDDRLEEMLKQKSQITKTPLRRLAASFTEWPPCSSQRDRIQQRALSESSGSDAE